MCPDELIAATAACQHGVFTSNQALRAGLTPKAIRHRCTTGRWIVLYRGVYAIAGAPRSIRQQLMAAVLAFGPKAIASHLSAALIWGLIEARPERIYVTLPHGDHRKPRRGIELHQATLARRDRSRALSIPVTAPSRTIVDVATMLSGEALESVLDNAIASGLLTSRSLVHYLSGQDLRRKRGMRELNELLRERAVGVPRNLFERTFRNKIRASGLPMPVRQHPFGSRKIDFAYPDKKIAIELDGEAQHSTGMTFRDDRRRQNQLVLADWVVLRFTWSDVRDHWPAVEATIRRAIGE